MAEKQALIHGQIMLSVVDNYSILLESNATNGIKPFLLKPSVMQGGQALMEEFGNDLELDVSYVYCFGISEPSITIMFLRGHETEFFIQSSRGEGSPVSCSLVRFSKLFENSNLKTEKNTVFKRMVARWGYNAIIEMSNGDLFVFDPQTCLLSRFTIPNIKHVGHFGFGVMNEELLVSTHSRQNSILLIEKNGTESELLFDHVGSIKFMRCFYSFFYLIILNDNRLFCYSKTGHAPRFDGFEVNEMDKFVYINTLFENTCPIKDIQVGFAHSVVLLENGQVFSRGYNSFNQVSMENSASDFTKEFKEIQIPNSIVKEISCSSICTYFRTSTHLLFMGTIGGAFENGLFTDEGKKLNVRYAIPVESTTQYSIAFGPWMVYIYRQSFPIVYDLSLFLNRMKEKIGNCVLADVSIKSKN